MTDRINPTAINQETIAEARERLAKRKGAAAAPASKAPAPEIRLSARAAAIQAAAKRAVPQDKVRLEKLSAYTDTGEPIDVTCRRLVIQELAASELLPVNATRIVDRLIVRGQEATEQERKRRGQQEPALPLNVGDEVDAAIEAEFGGMSMEAVDALYGLVNGVCVAAVVDPEMHIYFSATDAARDPVGVSVHDIPEDDRFAIFNWALAQEETAAASVEPFRGAAGVAGGPVSPDEARRGAAVRADAV